MSNFDNVAEIAIRASDFRPLPLFKEIMVMFCDINHNCFGGQKLRSFLLDKNSREGFNSQKYRVFCYIAKGPIQRSNGLSVNIYHVDNSPLIISMSEITAPPIGLALYIDMPDGYLPPGYEITKYSQFGYEDSICDDMILPILESNIVFSGDYRTKNDIERTMIESKKYLKEHPELETLQ